MSENLYHWTIEIEDDHIELYHEGACKQVIDMSDPTTLGYILQTVDHHECQS